jgi:hypothetical protein
MSFTRSGFISNKCWLYLNLLKITSCREPYWHTKKIILAKLYTHAFLSDILTLKKFMQQMCTQAILCHPPPLHGFMYRRSYKLTHFCVTCLYYRTVIQKTRYSRRLLVPYLYYKGSYLLYIDRSHGFIAPRPLYTGPLCPTLE